MAWLTGWTYRKSHVINSANGAGTNYQVKIKVYYGNGTDSGENVYLNGKCKTDFGDIRFTRSDGETLLDYWMEEKVDSNYALFWVEIADDLSTNPATIYIYYGNSTATTTSNGNNTFLFFDDFPGTSLDSSKWTVVSGTPVVENSYVKLTGNFSRIQTIPAFSRPTAFRIRAKSNANAQYNALDNYVYATDGAYRASGTCYTWSLLANYYPHTIYFQRTVNDNQIVLKNTGVDLDSTIWRTYELRATASTFRFFYDSDEDMPSVTDNAISSGYLELACYGTTDYRYWDWVAVRKYVDPEPSHGSWGSEETSQVTTRVVVEYLAGYDVKSRMASLYRVKTDYVGLLDIKSRIRGLHKTFIEYVGLLDSSIHGIVGYIYRTVTEYIGLLDTKIRTVNLHRIFIEQLGVLESKVKSLSKMFIEYIGLYDLVEHWKNITRRIITEFIGLKDTISKRKHLMRTFIEYVAVTETRIISKALHKIIVEYLGVKERYYKLPSFFKYFKWRRFQHPKQRVEVNS